MSGRGSTFVRSRLFVNTLDLFQLMVLFSSPDHMTERLFVADIHSLNLPFLILFQNFRNAHFLIINQ
jgi:hypothetical protein